MKSTIPNKPGDYVIEGISIIVLPEKILIDTGGSKTRRASGDDEDAYVEKKPGKKQGAKKNDTINSILDSAEDFIMGEGHSKRHYR
jgi:hypothetical protein